MNFRWSRPASGGGSSGRRPESTVAHDVNLAKKPSLVSRGPTCATGTTSSSFFSTSKRQSQRGRMWKTFLDASRSSSSLRSLGQHRQHYHNRSSNDSSKSPSRRRRMTSDESLTHSAAVDEPTSFTAFQPTTDLSVSVDGLHRSSFIIMSQQPSSSSSATTATISTSTSGTSASTISTNNNSNCSPTSTTHRRRSTAHPFSLPASTTPLPEPISYELHQHEHAELGFLQFRHTSVGAATRAVKYAAWKRRMHLQTTTTRQRQCQPILWVQAEIPGDVDIGRDVFSHPLLVEAAESLFMPVVEINAPHCRARSSNGKTCCTQVSLLLVDEEQEDSDDDQEPEQQHPQQQIVIAPQQLTKGGLVQAMVTALEQAGMIVPRYLTLLLEEQLGYDMYATSCSSVGDTSANKNSSDLTAPTRSRNQTARFGVTDSALAEADLAGLKGILSTRVGSLDRQKVIEITYDSKVLTYCALIRYALYQELVNVLYYRSNEERMVAQIEVTRMSNSTRTNNNLTKEAATVAVRQLEARPIKKAYDPKHALRQTPMRFVPLTPLQAARVNRLIHFGSFNEAVQLLSPRQGLILMKAMHLKAQKSFHEVVDVEILLAWNSVCSQQHPKVLREQRTAEPVQDDSEADDEECIMDTYNLCLHVSRRQSMYLPRF